jgi:hypothetical protein
MDVSNPYSAVLDESTSSPSSQGITDGDARRIRLLDEVAAKLAEKQLTARAKQKEIEELPRNREELSTEASSCTVPVGLGEALLKIRENILNPKHVKVT